VNAPSEPPAFALPRVSVHPAQVGGPGGAAPQPIDESQLSLAAVWVSIRKNWLIVLVIMTVVSVGVTFFTLGQTRIYESNTVVMFDPQQPRPLGDRVEMSVDNSYWSNKEYYKTQYWVIQSLRTTSEVVRSMGLNRDPSFWLNTPAKAGLPPGEISVEDAARVLQARITVDPIKDSRLAVVKYQDADPERARRITSAIADSYIQQNLGDMTDSSSSSGEWLHNQLGSLKQDVENSEMQLHDYKREKSILSLSMEDQVGMLRDEMRSLNGAVTESRTARESLRARRDELAKVNTQDPQDLPATELIASGMLQSLRQTYIAAARDVEVLESRGKGEAYPEVIAAIRKRDSCRDSVLKEISNIQRGLTRDLAESDRVEGGLRRLFQQAESQALDLNLLEIEYRRLARAKENNEKLYTLVMERSKESDLTRTLLFNNIRVVERPMLPSAPVSPNVPLNIAGGVAAGLVLGLVAALGREQLDRSVKTPDQVESLLGLTFLGLLPSFGGSADAKARYGGRAKKRAVPDFPLTAPELVVHEHPTSGIAEAARAIRTNVLFMSPDMPYRTLLVTSAGPSEGKTTVAACIAIAMAQAGRRVLLLDCDMRRPRLHKVFGKTKDVGITTALLDDLPLDQLVHSTQVPNLHLLTTGPLPPNPSEILHSESFARLLGRLRDSYDCVIIDSPPVVPVTDAAILSTQVDGTILVVRAFHTTKDLAKRAARALRDVGAPVVGTVLNAVDLDRHEYGYKYYYYYRREGYASEEEQPLQPSA
jgi:capsular exopolysaccharide synthesis family protein